MKKYLVTGFEPFAEFKTNPSAEFVRSLSDECFDLKVLSVDYAQIKKELAEIHFEDYKFIFLFGLAADRKEICFERVALNWMESSTPDNRGLRPSPQKIEPGFADALINQLPLENWVKDLNQELRLTANVKISHSAGAYLCNFLYFEVLQRNKNALFIHIPMDVKLMELRQILNRLIVLQALGN